MKISKFELFLSLATVFLFTWFIKISVQAIGSDVIIEDLDSQSIDYLRLSSSMIYSDYNGEKISGIRTFHVGDTCQYYVETSPGVFSNEGFTWEIQNTGFGVTATVDENGMVTAVAPGGAPLLVGNDEGKTMVMLEVCDELGLVPAVTVSITDYPQDEMNIGDTYQCQAIGFEQSDYNTPFVWGTTDSNVLTIDENGLLTAVSPGSAYIVYYTEWIGGSVEECKIGDKKLITVTENSNNIQVNFDEYIAPEGCVFQFRLYNPNSGEHFYTGSQEETLNLVSAGWNFEGSGFITPMVGPPIYRLYSAEHGDHFYTTSETERDELVAEGWTLDGGTGIAFPSATAETGRPMYRIHNPNAYPNGEAGAHHFTMSMEEVQNLTELGWIYEGIAWYSV